MKLQTVREFILARVSEVIEVPVTAIDPDKEFTSYGLDSLGAVTLSAELEEFLGRALDPNVFYDFPTVDRLARHLIDTEA